MIHQIQQNLTFCSTGNDASVVSRVVTRGGSDMVSLGGCSLRGGLSSGGHDDLQVCLVDDTRLRLMGRTS
jgi:hypothetical protein